MTATSPRCAPRRASNLSSHALSYSQIVPSAPRLLCVPSLQEQDSTLRALSQPSLLTSKYLVFEPVGCKTHKNQPLLISQPVALGECSSCTYPCVSYSFTFLCHQSYLPSAVPEICFSLKRCLCTSYHPWCGLFSPSTCAVCFVSSQVNLLGIQNDVIGNLAVFKGGGKSRVLLLCHHLSCQSHIS